MQFLARGQRVLKNDNFLSKLPKPTGQPYFDREHFYYRHADLKKIDLLDHVRYLSQCAGNLLRRAFIMSQQLRLEVWSKTKRCWKL